MNDIALGLSSLSLPNLLALKRAVEDKRVRCPPDEEQLISEGFAEVASIVASYFSDVKSAGMRRTLDAVIAERVHGNAPSVDLIWNGPEATSTRSLDGGATLQSLFDAAKSTVLIAGLGAEDDPKIFDTLYGAMVRRHVQVSIFLSAEQPIEDEEQGRQLAEDFLQRFWPYEGPRPEIFFGPMQSAAGSAWISLRTHCIVVDEEQTLIATDEISGLDARRHIELGVVVKDQAFARRVLAEWTALFSAGLVARYEG